MQWPGREVIVILLLRSTILFNQQLIKRNGCISVQALRKWSGEFAEPISSIEISRMMVTSRADLICIFLISEVRHIISNSIFQTEPMLLLSHQHQLIKGYHGPGSFELEKLNFVIQILYVIIVFIVYMHKSRLCRFRNFFQTL